MLDGFLSSLLLVVVFMKCSAENFVRVNFQPQDVSLAIDHSQDVSVGFSRPLQLTTELIFTYETGSDGESFVQRYEIVEPLLNVTVSNGTNVTEVTVTAVHAGKVTIGLNKTSPEFDDLSHSFLLVTVMHSYSVDIISIVIGWMYFFAWSISFYPQIIENIQRKSVQGLNFDFVAYNLTGHFCYGVFNVGLFWSTVVQSEYFSQHRRGINPVQLNDVVFSLHATAACLITGLQCFIYESGGQKLSKVCYILLGLMWLFLIISLFVAVGHAITWLQYLYYFSYVKLAITLIKYVPQAVMNFRRKSTVGWSIGNVLLDFTGGILSMLQMFLLAYNTDDWDSIKGDPTKFGLGLFSVLFDVLFMIQHYVLYRHSRSYSAVNGS